MRENASFFIFMYGSSEAIAGNCCMRLAQKKVELQGMHIDALTCSCCVGFMKIKNGVYPVGLVTDKNKIPAQVKQSREPGHKGKKAVSHKRDHIGSLS